MKPTILCVDDDRDTLDLLTGRLACAGWRIRTATTGGEALEIIRADRPDLLLLGLLLPDIDGFGVCEILRGDPATAALPIVILSAWSSPDLAQLATEFGVLDIVRTPCDPQKLVERLGRLTGLPASTSTPRTGTPPSGPTSGSSELIGHSLRRSALQIWDFPDDDWAGLPCVLRKDFCRVADY